MAEGGIRVRLPRSLRAYWAGPAEMRVEGSTLAEVLARLSAEVPGLAERILDDQGRLRRHVVVFVNESSVDAPPETVRVAEGDTVHVVPSVSGGFP